MPTPADLLDLSVWKLTLPVGSKGKPTEVKQPALATFSDPNYFHVSPDGKGVAFRAPVNGVTTSGSKNPRSELRELAPGGDWSSTDGKTHTLIIDQAFNHMPNPRTDSGTAGVVGGQIHNASDDVSVFRCEGSKLWVTNGNNTHFALADGNYSLGTRVQCAFVVAGGKVFAFYNGKLVTTIPAKFSGAYFKSGAYVQANASNSKPADSSNFGEVTVYGLTVAHGAAIPIPTPGTSPTPVPTPVPVPTPTPIPVPPKRPTRVMLARHGEKPAGSVQGYAPDGTVDPHSLTKQGWARAAGFVGLFDPPNGAVKAGLSTPTVIYVADGPSAGERMWETASLLAAALKLPLNRAYDKGKESNLAKALKALPAGTQALVVWEHSMLPKIGKALGKVSPKQPSAYPSNRFDVVWVYDLQPDGSWKFSQVNESILPTDKGYITPTAGVIAAIKQAFGIGV